MRMKLTRRGVLGATAGLITVAAGAGDVLADSHEMIEVVDVNAEDEYVVFENAGEEEIDLSGYVVDFENQGPDTQTRPLPEGTALGAGEQLTVATGSVSVSDADVTFDYDDEAPQINNEDPDVIALLAPDGQRVVASMAINQGTGDGTQAHVRVAHLVPDAPAVDVYVDGSEVLSGIGVRDVTGYLSVPVGTNTVEITPADQPDTVVFEGEVSFESGRTTLAVMGELGENSLSVETLDDESGLHDPSKALVRVVHASPDAPSMTISANGSPLFEDLAFGSATEYAEVAPGEYEIAVGPASDPSQSVASFDLSVDGCSVYTVFAVGYLTPDDEPADEPFGVVTALDDSGLEVDYATQLSGANEVPPVDTDAAGSAVFDLRGDGQVLRYEVAATGLENTLQGHIHAGGPDENGPVVAFLYDFTPLDAAEEGRTLEGTLGNANITADDLVGPLEGESLDALVDLIESGEAYVNLHTVANPSGEIRGQIHSEGT